MGWNNSIDQAASGSNIIQTAGNYERPEGFARRSAGFTRGRHAERVWTPGYVTSIDFSGIGMLSSVPGNVPNVKAHALETLLPHVKIGNQGGWLTIGVDPAVAAVMLENRHLKFDVVIPCLRKVHASGVVELRLEGLAGKRFDLCAEGAASVFLSGNVDACAIWASGAVRVHGRGFVCRDIQVDVSGAARVEITAREKVAASASGAGYVIVHGNPAVQKIRTDEIAEVCV